MVYFFFFEYWILPRAIITTSGQSNLTSGRIAAAHGRFSHIRQVAPMRTHLVHPSRHPHWPDAAAAESLWVYRHLQRTRYNVLLVGRKTPQNCPSSLGDLHSIWYMAFWAYASLQPKRHADRLSRFCTGHRRVSHYFTMRRYVFPIFIHGDLDLWPLTLTFKLLRARDQTRLPCEFGANPFGGSRYILHTDKKLQTAPKTEPYAVHSVR